MKTFEFICLGSGTSYGVPVPACRCDVCRSDDPMNRRTRCSAILRIRGRNVLVDAATDFRAQALREGLDRIDAVLVSHSHADHLHGIDDLRAFSLSRREPIPTYGNKATLADIRDRFGYMFDDPTFHLGWGIPRLELHEIDAPSEICGAMVIPVPVLHGNQSILGFRVGGLAYLTDCSGIPDDSRELLRDLDTLVIDGLRPRPHPTHFSIPEALEVVAELGPRQAFLTHLTHEIDHASFEKTLPDSVRLAYDGLRLTVPL